MALSATHAKRDAIVLHASRGFASAPNSPRVFLQSSSSSATSRRTAGRTTATDLGPVFLPNRPTDAVEEILTRICSMFPTAREYDVRELLAKYVYIFLADGQAFMAPNNITAGLFVKYCAVYCSPLGIDPTKSMMRRGVLLAAQ